MQQTEKQDMERLKTLMERTGEFVAYFELVEEKMIEWRQNIEQQLQDLSTEAFTLKDMITEAGLAQLKLVGETLMAQSKEIVEKSEQIQNDAAKLSSQNHDELHELCQSILKKISLQADDAMEKIDQQLKQYDVKQFNRIANESCNYVATCAQNAVQKSQKILQLFHWRSVMLSIGIAIISVCIFSVYSNDEYPWELHQHAQNERNAGKMLMNAWSKLSPAERSKILSQQA